MKKLLITAALITSFSTAIKAGFEPDTDFLQNTLIRQNKEKIATAEMFEIREKKEKFTLQWKVHNINTDNPQGIKDELWTKISHTNLAKGVDGIHQCEVRIIEQDKNSLNVLSRFVITGTMSEDLNQAVLKVQLPGDLYWQVFQNLKIPLENLQVRNHHNSINLKKPLSLRADFGLFPSLEDEVILSDGKEKKDKTFLAGIFHPEKTTMNNTVMKLSGGWNDYWGIRLSHVTTTFGDQANTKNVSPHQMESYPMYIFSNDLFMTWESSPKNLNFWSLVFLPDEKKGIITFHNNSTE